MSVKPLRFGGYKDKKNLSLYTDILNYLTLITELALSYPSQV